MKNLKKERKQDLFFLKKPFGLNRGLNQTTLQGSPISLGKKKRVESKKQSRTYREEWI